LHLRQESGFGVIAGVDEPKGVTLVVIIRRYEEMQGGWIPTKVDV
jgi:hypothetical protein